MKWTSFLGVLILSFGLCSQTFGFELLDRILGIGNSGCCESSCGCEAEPECGCEAEPDCGCEAEPDCGCEAEPDCGCDTGCNKQSRRTLLDDLLSGLRKSCGCDTTDCCDAGGDADAEEAAPMPPAPIVDPSAFVPQKRRVVQASTTTIVR